MMSFRFSSRSIFFAMGTLALLVGGCSHFAADMCAPDAARVSGYEDASAGKPMEHLADYEVQCGRGPEADQLVAQYRAGYQRRILEVCQTDYAVALGKEAAQRFKIDPLSENPFGICTEGQEKLTSTAEKSYLAELCQTSVQFAAGADHGRRLEPSVGPLLTATCPAGRKVELAKSYLAGHAEGLAHACSVTELYVKGLEHAKSGLPLSPYLSRLERCPEPSRFDGITAYTSGYENAQFRDQNDSSPAQGQRDRNPAQRASRPGEDRG